MSHPEALSLTDLLLDFEDNLEELRQLCEANNHMLQALVIPEKEHEEVTVAQQSEQYRVPRSINTMDSGPSPSTQQLGNEAGLHESSTGSQHNGQSSAVTSQYFDSQQAVLLPIYDPQVNVPHDNTAQYGTTATPQYGTTATPQYGTDSPYAPAPPYAAAAQFIHDETRQYGTSSQHNNDSPYANTQSQTQSAQIVSSPLQAPNFTGMGAQFNNDSS